MPKTPEESSGRYSRAVKCEHSLRGGVAQSAEPRPVNPVVVGSSPTALPENGHKQAPISCANRPLFVQAGLYVQGRQRPKNLATLVFRPPSKPLRAPRRADHAGKDYASLRASSIASLSAEDLAECLERPDTPPLSIWSSTKRRVAAPYDRTSTMEHCS